MAEEKNEKKVTAATVAGVARDIILFPVGLVHLYGRLFSKTKVVQWLRQNKVFGRFSRHNPDGTLKTKERLTSASIQQTGLGILATGQIAMLITLLMMRGLHSDVANNIKSYNDSLHSYHTEIVADDDITNLLDDAMIE